MCVAPAAVPRDGKCVETSPLLEEQPRSREAPERRDPPACTTGECRVCACRRWVARWALRMLGASAAACTPLALPLALASTQWDPSMMWLAVFPDKVLWVSGYTLHNFLYWVMPTALAALGAAAALRAQGDVVVAFRNRQKPPRRLLRLFAALWVLATSAAYVCNAARARIEKEEAGMGWSDTRAASESLSYAFGPAGLFLTLAALMPVSRGAELLAGAGVSVEGALRVHALAGRICLAALLAHGAGYAFTWARYDGVAVAAARLAAWPSNAYGVVNLAGGLSLVGGALAAIAALPAVRRGCYEAFLWGHLLGAAVFYLMACAHASWICWCLAPATLIWAIERAHRAHSRSTLQRARISMPARSLLRVHLPDVPLTSGHAIAWLTVPQLGGSLGAQTHPFSFLPAAGGGCVAFVRVVAAAAGDASGSWTQHLASLAPKDGSNAVAAEVAVRVDGPHVSEHQQLPPDGEMALVGGGAGVMPLLALLNGRCLARRASARGAPGGYVALPGDGQPLNAHTRVCLVTREADDCVMLEVLAPETIRELHGGGVSVSVSLTRGGGDADPEASPSAAAVAAVAAALSLTPLPAMAVSADGHSVGGDDGVGACWHGELAVLLTTVGMLVGTVLAEGATNGFGGDGPIFAVFGDGWAKGMLLGVLLNAGAFAGAWSYVWALRMMRRRRATAPADVEAPSDLVPHSSWQGDKLSAMSAAAAVRVSAGRPDVGAFVAGSTAAVVSGSPGFVAMALEGAASSGVPASAASLDMAAI